MSVVLPCSDVFLRTLATQRDTAKTLPNMRLHPVVERDLAELLAKEIDF